MSDSDHFKAKINNNNNDPDYLDELRSLIVGPEQTQIAQIEQRINEEQLSEVLPEIIVLSSNKDKRLYKALSPVLEESISHSVKKNPKPLVDAIFPIIGPAVRRSISQALNQLIQSTNEALENSFNISWRIEALKSGKSFSEIVLKNSLLYRVEQVFLIHKETGLLLAHESIDENENKDSDLISAMLSAIQDFVKDSFSVEEGDLLESFQVGEFKIWVEQGPYAIIAAVIKGNPPFELRNKLKETLESVHLEYSLHFDSFDGDTEPFNTSSELLRQCIVTKLQKKKKGSNYKTLAILLILLLCISGWLFFKVRSDLRWSDYLSHLRNEPGIVITDSGKRDGKYYVEGLRDPLATNPADLLSETNIKTDQVVENWEQYLSFNNELTIKRTRLLLDVPNSAEISLENGIIYLKGSATNQWIQQLNKINKYIPGVTKIDSSELVPSELSEINSLRQQIQKTNIYFELGKSELQKSEESKLNILSKNLIDFTNLSNNVNKPFTLVISGHTDKTGTEKLNKSLSMKRAAAVKSYLRESGLNVDDYSTLGLGATNPSNNDTNIEGSEINRRVTLEIIYKGIE